MTNYEFGEKVGCDYTMASRLRNGHRLPSTGLLIRIRDAFELPSDEILAAYNKGSAEFGQFLQQRIFKKPEPVGNG